jgi:hypothetical protein
MHCKLDREYRIAETYWKNLTPKSYLFLFLNKKIDTKLYAVSSYSHDMTYYSPQQDF